jgi:hypothetical protein
MVVDIAEVPLEVLYFTETIPIPVPFSFQLD